MKCDIHPWMNAIYFVAPHPYHELTSEKADAARGTAAGEAVFTDVPPGTYEVVVLARGDDREPHDVRREDLGLRVLAPTS